MIIIGLNAYHADAAACLVKDGVVVGAAEEERFRRIKHWAGFPADAIRSCLNEAGLTLRDIDCVAINSNPNANWWRRASYALWHRPDIRLIRDRLKNQSKRLGTADELARHFPGVPFRGRIERVEHHLAHAASAYFPSPFAEAVTVSVDGFGDFASAAWGTGRGNALSIDGRAHFPHSLGIFYQALTQYLGFWNYGDEYKVMGLAPYGEPVYVKELAKVVGNAALGHYELDLRYFRHHREPVAYRWDHGTPEVGALFSPALEALLGPARRSGDELTAHHRNIARSVQVCYEDVLFRFLEGLHARYRIPNLALSGGCAMNSVANGKITSRTPFKKLYVPASAGDAGGAVGAALSAWNTARGERTKDAGASLGPRFTNSDIEALLNSKKDSLAAEKCRKELIPERDHLCRDVAAAIGQGHVIGWFDGRMEWGPRALGQRSILGDPRRADMKAILNDKIKRRESFRPFAPSVLEERAAEWFETDAKIPFMSEVHPVRPEKRSLVPAVTHVDGSGRLQTVSRETSPHYWQLIEAFFQMTGIPMLLNTSFNENEPIVCRPEEALDCFLRTKMDVLVLENWIVRRN